MVSIRDSFARGVPAGRDLRVPDGHPTTVGPAVRRKPPDGHLIVSYEDLNSDFNGRYREVLVRGEGVVSNSVSGRGRVDEHRAPVAALPPLFEGTEGLVDSKRLGFDGLFLVPWWNSLPVHPCEVLPSCEVLSSCEVLQTEAAPTLPSSCREPSAQMVSSRFYALTVRRAVALSSTTMLLKKRHSEPHSCPSEVSPRRITDA